MQNILCRFDSFDEVIKLNDRILNNSEVSTFKVTQKNWKRNHRLLNMMSIYNN